MKIVVLAGGLSHERDVSLSSGCQITNALREMGNKVLLLDLYEGIELKDSDYGRLFKGIEDGEPEVYCVPKEEPDLDEIVKRNNNGNSFVGKNVIEICKYADIVFMALHGGVGENGKLQGMFDILGIKYTGSGAAGSMLAMDKDLTKKLLRYEGIPTADWAVYNKNENTIDDIIKKIEFPCVIKPCNNGSSVGVAIAENIEQLKESINVAEKIEQDIMVEKKIVGREFTIGVVENKTLPIIEIVTKGEFFDYLGKYQKNMVEEICPAELTVQETNRLQSLTLAVHKALKLGKYSRIDFILGEDGEFYCLEANTLPGMTPTSLIPIEAKASGIGYKEFCQHLIDISLK